MVRLNRQAIRELGAQRVFWIIEQIGQSEERAFNATMNDRPLSVESVVRTSLRHDADPVLVLAMLGWLPSNPTGADPYLQVDDPGAVFVDAFLLSDRHRWAYALYAEAARERHGDHWSPYPRVHMPTSIN